MVLWTNYKYFHWQNGLLYSATCLLVYTDTYKSHMPSAHKNLHALVHSTKYRYHKGSRFIALYFFVVIHKLLQVVPPPFTVLPCLISFPTIYLKPLFQFN